MTIICVTVWKTKPVRGPGAKVEDEDDDVMPDGADINEGRDCSVKPQASILYITRFFDTKRDLNMWLELFVWFNEKPLEKGC